MPADLRVLRAELDGLLESAAAQSLRAGRLSRKRGASPLRTDIGAPGSRIESLEDRIGQLEDLVLVDPKLLSTAEIDEHGGTLADELYSIRHYRSLALDPTTTVQERARALLNLSCLPYPEAHFDSRIEAAWLRDVTVTRDERVLGELVQVYRALPGSDSVRGALSSMARNAPSDHVRERAMNSLNQHFDDESVRALATEALLHDPSALVRERAQDLLRRADSYSEE